MSNVVSLRTFRTLKECQKLFIGYEDKLKGMSKDELMGELERYRVESARYPEHLLTIVKGQIILRMVRRRPISLELRHFVDSESDRLEATVAKKVHSAE